MRRLLLLAGTLLGLSAAPAHAFPVGLDETLTTEHFQVHFTGDVTTTHAMVRQWAGELAANAEWAYDTYVSQWGYPAHVDDGDGLIDVYVYSFLTEYGGNYEELGAFSVPLTGNAQSAGRIEVNLPFVRDPHVAAHQVFHMLQMAMYAPAPDWLAQSTAEWAAYRLRGHPAPFAFHQPDNSLDCATAVPDPYPGAWVHRPCGADGYEASGYTRWTFFQYLEERFGANVVRDVWSQTQAVGSTAYDGDDAIRDVLAGKGASLTDVFGDYTVAMLTGSFQTSLLAGQTPALYATATTPAENGAVPALRVAVNRLAARFVSLKPPAPDETPCYAATLALTVTLPAGVTSRPHVYATGTKTLTALAVSGTTATASIPWDTCSDEAPALLSLPNTSQTLDGRMFVVAASVTVDKTKIVSAKTPPPGATVIGPVIAAPTEDPAPSLSFYSRKLLRLSSSARLLRFVLYADGAGKVRVTFNGQAVGLVSLRAGANTAAVRLPKPAARYSSASRAVLELTALSPSGSPGTTFVQRVAFVRPKPKRGGR